MGDTTLGDRGDRMDRAGRYVLGLMDDAERERAERDLEIDPAFRDAMVEIAERMHVFDHMPAPPDAAASFGIRSAGLAAAAPGSILLSCSAAILGRLTTTP